MNDLANVFPPTFWLLTALWIGLVLQSRIHEKRNERTKK